MIEIPNKGINEKTSRTEEIELVQLVLLLWRYKLWFCACTATIVMIGIAYAFLATPVFSSFATIAPKEPGKGSDASRLFSQLGGMGGVVASQLGLGNTNLDRIEVILKGHELAEAVINRHGLMPILFQDKWDDRNGKWKAIDSAEIPKLRDGVKIIREHVISVGVDAKRNLLKIGIDFRDPEIAKRLVDYYLDELNRHIRENVILDAEANRAYLERQLNNTTDPVLMEKIQSMIAVEIEKAMLISNQSFEVLERPVVPMERSKPKRKFLVILAFLIGGALSVIGIALWRSLETIRKAHGSITR